MEVEINLNLKDIVHQWARQAGKFGKNISKLYRQDKYLSSMQQLTDLFLKRHEDFKDKDFIRIYRFFLELPVNIEESLNTGIKKRYQRLKDRDEDLDCIKK